MSITGNLLKETARLSYEFLPRTIRNQAQDFTLEKLLQKARKTEFGLHYDFDAILNHTDSTGEFTRRVPLFTYADFHKEWLHKPLNGEKNVIWPGKINYFALSSGTTVDTSKKIPVSDKMIRQFQRTSFQQLAELYEFDLHPKFYNSSVLTVGGSTQLERTKDYLQGDLSGILQKNKSFVFKPFTKPNNGIAKLTDWNEKMEQIIAKAPTWDIGVIAGVPTWVLMLINGIVKTYKLKSIHDIWPNFSLYLHGGVFLDGYREKIEALCGKEIFFQNTLLASEGYFAYQKNVYQKGLNLLLNHGVFYEFLEEKYFSLVNDHRSVKDLPTLNLSQVEEGKNYGLIISTCSGLWRYLIGDVVRFQDLKEFRFDLVGRVSQTLNSAGEHLSVENLNDAINRTATNLGMNIQEFCVYPSKNGNRHNWYIGVNAKVDTRRFEVELNSNLCALNDDYRTLRKYMLKSPKVIALPVEKFYEFLESRNKLGGQHKFARVMNKNQALAWEAFLTRLDL
ncbi:GH3 auxin-responsive promoter family protein [Lishizhenia sp.]|uniref:GH3 family domain-containing protein n=1 Tax=Lishizhenia sp. TaxID=2497594 RepID=UPI00299EB7B9|nr:GH3 auxin-responsive promoter family protein [Lishizhenia sp.]MDX1444604.1 GH3 auxin-responsive promoter family protein [Lishizhenia sp.]